MSEPLIINVKPLPDIVPEAVDPTEERFVLALTPKAEFCSQWFEIIDLADERQYQAELALLQDLVELL